MPKFILTIGRDATVYFSAEVEAENTKAIHSQMGKRNYHGETLTEWEEISSQTYDNIEHFTIRSEDGEELYDSADAY